MGLLLCCNIFFLIAFLFLSSQKQHTGAPSHPRREEFTQTANCSDRRAPRLLQPCRRCQKRQTGSQRGRWVGRQTGRRVRRAGENRRLGPSPSTPTGGLSAALSRQGMCPPLLQCKPAGTHGHPCCTAFSRHKQMFSGYCCPASPLIVFGGTRCQFVSCNMEGQSVFSLQDVTYRRSNGFPLCSIRA